MSTWTRIDPHDQTTWPERNKLVLVADEWGGFHLRSFRYEDYDNGIYICAYDESNDYDDGMEEAELLRWCALPEAPEAL